MRRKKAFFSAVCIGLIVAIGATGILFTNSKYTATENGEVTTSVAKWVFDISGRDTYSDDDGLETINLAQTCDELTLLDKQIAPGTSGSFDVEIDATGSEVGIDYVVTFTDIPTNFPKNLKFYVDGNPYDLEAGFSGNIPANATNQIVTKTVNWEWLYETPDGDKDDTDDGIADANDLTFGITVTGTQVRPVAN